MLAPCVHHRWAGGCNITCVCSNYGNATRDACVIWARVRSRGRGATSAHARHDPERERSLNEIVALDRDASPSGGMHDREGVPGMGATGPAAPFFF